MSGMCCLHKVHGIWATQDFRQHMEQIDYPHWLLTGENNVTVAEFLTQCRDARPRRILNMDILAHGVRAAFVADRPLARALHERCGRARFWRRARPVE